jgi:CDP-diacylglycerol--serine O-phosphatidyltransferase
MLRRRRLIRRERLKGLSINRMIPNILTLLALCAGMTAVRFGLQENWKAAVVAIVVAGVFDGLDGRVARLLKGSSKFGAELDSLSDFLCFGVAPAVVLYLWTMQSVGTFGWVLALLYAVCCALRLARFNTALEEPSLPPWAYNFFSGVPSPAGAGLAIFPMILSFEWGDQPFRRPEVVGVVMVVVAALMVSRMPTFSFKKFKVPSVWILPTMLIVGLIAASLVGAPWATMSALLFLYILSFPFGVLSYRKLARLAAEVQGLAPPTDAAKGPPETAETHPGKT